MQFILQNVNLSKFNSKLSLNSKKRNELFISQTDSTIAQDNILNKAAATASTPTTINNKQGEDIMSVLLAHEKKGGMSDANAVKSVIPQESSDSSDNEENNEMQPVETGKLLSFFHFKQFIIFILFNPFSSFLFKYFQYSYNFPSFLKIKL